MKSNYITKANIWRIVGIISLIFWTFALVGALLINHKRFLEEILPICLICVPLIIFSFLMLQMSILWYIGVNEDKITIRNMFGVTKTYENDELTLVVSNPKKKGTQKFYVYKGNKKITSFNMFDSNIKLIADFKNRKVEESK